MFIEYLGLIGFTLIITTGYITENFRFWLIEKNKVLGRFFSCSMCVGFWIGFFYSLFFTTVTINNHILFGCAISFLSYLSDSLINFLKVSDELLWWKNKNSNRNSSTKIGET